MYSSGNSFQGGFYNNNNNNNNNNRNNNNNPFNQNQNQNQNNFQNNNQNNNNNAPQNGVVTTKFPVAIGPVTDSNISAILESIQMKLLLASNKTNLNILRLTPSFNFDYEYITLYLENANQITEMININPFYFHDEQIFIAASDSPNDEIYINFVDSIFPDCITGTFLDLSDIERKSRPTHVLDATGIDINLRYSAMPFILFLTALKCKVLLLIAEYISFDNNMLSDSRHLRYFRYFFPYLKKLSISGNFGEVMAYKSEKLAKNIRMNDQNKERLLDFYTKELKSFKKAGVIVEEQTQLTHAKFEDPKNFKNNFGHPGFRQPVLPPREVTQLTDVVVPILTSDQICAENNTVNLGTNTVCYNTITQNEEVHFNKYDFPANAFISSFITDGKSSIPSLVKYYSDNAVFSLTCDSCPPNSPMMYFHQFSTNRANNDTFYHAQGPQAICQAQFQVFGGCFCSIVTSASLSVLASDAFAAVLHGGFQNTEGVAYAFDRTMMIMKNESGFLIVNDHIFIRNARFI